MRKSSRRSLQPDPLLSAGLTAPSVTPACALTLRRPGEASAGPGWKSASGQHCRGHGPFQAAWRSEGGRRHSSLPHGPEPPRPRHCPLARLPLSFVRESKDDARFPPPLCPQRPGPVVPLQLLIDSIY